MLKDIIISRATGDNIKDIVPIFNLYRAFYGMPKDDAAALRFLMDRLEQNHAVLLYAQQGGTIVGFAQLFITFSSTSLKKVYVLNDLFVLADNRKKGIATLLINEVIKIGKQEQCARISLSTAKDNAAQYLYEKLGFQESAFKFYNYTFD